MKRKLTNDPLELFRTLPHGIKLKIYRFTIHVFDSRQELIEAVDLHVETRYATSPRGGARRWPYHHPIGKWDVFSHVFSRSRNRSTEHFNEDLSLWDVSNGSNFVAMFWDCYSFNGDVSKWHVSNATDLGGMFNGCRLFNADVSQWNVLNVTNLSCMFEDCRSFNATRTLHNGTSRTRLI
jgi:surface protein